MQKITTLVFDIGNVLTHFSFEPIAVAISGHTPLRFEEARDVIVKWSHPFCLGDLDEAAFAQRCMDDLQFSGDVDDLRRIYNLGFSPNTVMAGVIEAQVGTRALHYLSDTNPWHLEHLLAHDPLLQHFDGGMSSFVARALKPDAAIYQNACQELGITPSEAVFIDDRAANVAGAEALGFAGIVYDVEQHGSFEEQLRALLAG